MENTQVDPEHAALFEQMFGSECKGQNVDIMDPKIKEKIKEMSSPIPIRLSESFFKLLLTIFTKIMPIATISSIIFSNVLNGSYKIDSLKDSFKVVFVDIIPKIWYMVLIAALFWVVLQTLNYLVQFTIVKFYDHQLKKMLKDYKKYSELIKDKLRKDEPSEDQQRKDLGGYTEEEIIAHAKEAVELAKRKQEETAKSETSQDNK